MTQGKGAKSQAEQGGLMKEVELAIGAPVMVTLKIHTDLDVTNRVQGEVVKIVMSEREEQNLLNETPSIHLHHPLQYVLVKLLRTKAPTLEDLPPNVIPIIPITKTFTIDKEGTKLTIH